MRIVSRGLTVGLDMFNDGIMDEAEISMSGTEDKRSRRQRVSSVRMRDLSATSCVDNGSLYGSPRPKSQTLVLTCIHRCASAGPR